MTQTNPVYLLPIWLEELETALRDGWEPDPTLPLTSPLGEHGWQFEHDDDGDKYLKLELGLKGNCFAEIDSDTYGTLQGIRIYFELDPFNR